MGTEKDQVDSPSTTEAETSGAAVVDATATVVATDADANAAGSSDAGDKDANRQSLLDVMRDAIGDKGGAEAADSSTAANETGAEGDAEKSGAEATGGEEEPDDTKLPFHKHPRWQQVIAERDELRPRAERFDQITGFMEQHSLLPEEVSEGFQIMALLKSGDPEKLQEAVGWFEDRLHALRDALGIELPEDIRSRLDAGEIDAVTASELSATRAAQALRENRDKIESERTEQAKTRDEAVRLGTAMASAVQDWESGIARTDPDYGKKAEMVQTTVQALIAQGGHPKTVEEAVALVKKAYDKVSSAMRAIVPAPRPKDTTSPAGSSAPTQTRPATLREALEASIAA